MSYSAAYKVDDMRKRIAELEAENERLKERITKKHKLWVQAEAELHDYAKTTGKLRRQITDLLDIIGEQEEELHQRELKVAELEAELQRWKDMANAQATDSNEACDDLRAELAALTNAVETLLGESSATWSDKALRAVEAIDELLAG